MPNSPKMGWPSPEKDQDPYYDTFQSMVVAMDSSAYSAREDRGILISQGGNVAFTASSGALTWSLGIAVLSPIAGFKMTLPAGGTTLLDGQCLYVNVVRSPSGNITLSGVVSNQLPNSDVAMLLAIRNGASVYWRNGAVVNDGDNRPLFGSGATPVPSAIYGGGINGPLHFDGTSTVFGMTPSAGVYTMTQDVWPSTAIIDSGVQVTGPYRFICSISLVLNGIIHRNGNRGSDASPGSGEGGATLAGGSLPASGSGGSANGNAGFSGGSYVSYKYSTGIGGIGGTNSVQNGANATGFGAGGGGGLVPGNSNGGLGGNSGNSFAGPGGPDVAQAQWVVNMGVPQYNGGLILGFGTSGGGGGAGNGGGGSAAGMVVVGAPVISGTGSIQSVGGNGGNSGGGFGGGGGGGGGQIYIITTGELPSMSVAEGIGGVGATSIDGGNGSPGLIIPFVCS